MSKLHERVCDEKGGFHTVEIFLPQEYPHSKPSLAAEVPYSCELLWRKSSRLKDVIQQFNEHIKKLREFWFVLEEIDRGLQVVQPRQESRAASFRQICLDDGCQILLHINPRDPRSKPECRFLGPDFQTNMLRKSWRKNGRKWLKDKPFTENLHALLAVDLPGPPAQTTGCVQDECGICYVHFLPSDGELGTSTGTAVDYTCDNLSCKKGFHTVCLRDWLKSISTTRQSFNVLFGKCPYCFQPVAVKAEAN
ncbi:zinc ion binding protein [Wolffia australiana]